MELQIHIKKAAYLLLILFTGCGSKQLYESNFIRQYSFPIVALADSTLVGILDNAVFMVDSCDLSQRHFRSTFYAYFHERGDTLHFWFQSEYGNYFAFNYFQNKQLCLFHRSNIFIIEGDDLTLHKLFSTTAAIFTYAKTSKTERMPSSYVTDMKWSKIEYSGFLYDGDTHVSRLIPCK